MDPRQIGIITGDTGLFSNGLIQNAYFLHEVFTKLGHSCQLLSYSTTNVILEHVGIPVRTISDDPSLFNVSDYKTIVTVATGITQSMYAKCKANRVSVVGFICGNSMFMNLVDFTAEPPRNAVIGKERPVDALWIIGAYDFMKAYLELLRGAPATLVPHLWSPRLLEAVVIERFKKPISSLAYSPTVHTGRKVELIVLEPNLHMVKTALIPLMAAERVYLDAKELLNDVFLFNYPTENKNADAILGNLSVKDKVRKFKSLHIGEILTFFNEKEAMPIFVCHQHYNGWNYLYYELMYYGYPFVHNSALMKDFGYYYEEFDIAGCAQQIQKAHAIHNRVALSTMARARAYLANLDPLEEESGRAWSALLKSVTPPLSTKKRLQDYKVIFICPDHNAKYNGRKLHMMELLTSMGFKDIVHFKSGNENYPICLIKANIDLLTQYMDEPFLLLEDDVEYTGGSTEIDIAEDVDAIYCGLSLCAAHMTKNINTYYAEYSNYSDSQVRILNMLSGHAILYVSKAYKQAVLAEMKAHMDVPWDITIARIHSKFNVLGMRKPLFYQSNKFNVVASNGFDVEKATKIEFGFDNKIRDLVEPPTLEIL